MSDLLHKQGTHLKVLFFVGALLIAGALVWAVSSLKSASDGTAPPWQAAIDELQASVQLEREGLQALKESLEVLRGHMQQTAARVDKYQESQALLDETIQIARQLAERAQSTADASEASVKELQGQVALLEQRISQPVAVKAAPLAAKTVAVRPAAHRPQTLTPPFRVLEIEYRGGEAFLMVAPKDSHSLSDIRLLREGDSLLGWQLATLSPQQAQFAVGGRKHSVPLRAALSMN